MNYKGLFIDETLPKSLNNEELYNYFEKMKLGDMTARDEIINHNIELVIGEVVRKFSDTPYELNELVSIGLVGLIKSVDNFDITKALRFTAYSIRCIDNEIFQFMRKEKRHSTNISLNQTIYVRGEKLKVENTLFDDSFDFTSEYENNDSYDVIRNVIEKLPEREKIIVKKYFGFMNNQTMTQKEIADELCMSQAQVCRVIKKALENVSVKLKTLGIIEGQRKTRNKKQVSEKTKKVKEIIPISQLLNNLTPKEVIIAFLKLGYVDGKYFTTESISKFLEMDSEEVEKSINKFTDVTAEYALDQQLPNVLTKRKDN